MTNGKMVNTMRVHCCGRTSWGHNHHMFMQKEVHRHRQRTLHGTHNENIPIRLLLLDENKQLMRIVRLKSCTFADLVRIHFNDPDDHDTTASTTTRLWPQASTEPGYKFRECFLNFNLCNVEMNQEGASWLKKSTTQTTTRQHHTNSIDIMARNLRSKKNEHNDAHATGGKHGSNTNDDQGNENQQPEEAHHSIEHQQQDQQQDQQHHTNPRDSTFQSGE